MMTGASDSEADGGRSAMRWVAGLARAAALAAALAATCAGVAAEVEVPQFDLSDKRRSEGTLHFLQRNGLWESGSFYELELFANEDVDASVVMEDMLLRYEIKDSYIWANKITGSIVTEDPHDDANFTRVTIKDLNAELYTLTFGQTDFGPASNVKDDRVSIDVDYVIGHQTFTHTVPLESEGRVADKPSGEIADKVFSGQSVSNQFGGAIYNRQNGDRLTCISGYFFGNSTSNGVGGAIANYGSRIAEGISGIFINNSSINRGEGTQGGAIWNYDGGAISRIDGVFISNSARRDSGALVQGGAIANITSSDIDVISGYFIGNYVEGTGYNGKNQLGGDNDVVGGAIYNADKSHIRMIIGDFMGNSAWVTSGGSTDVHGGAIFNAGSDTQKFYDDEIGRPVTSSIDYIIGDFYGNRSDVLDIYNNENLSEPETLSAMPNSFARGGAIANFGCTAQQATNYQIGGATIYSIQGAFVRNYARAWTEADGGAIYCNRLAYIGRIESNFVRNYAESVADGSVDRKPRASGGAIANFSGMSGSNPTEIAAIQGSFYGNFVRANHGIAVGGAIANHGLGADGDKEPDAAGTKIGSIVGDFIGNYAQSSSGKAQGGAIYTQTGSIIDRIDGSFYNNYAKSITGEASGGAILNGGDLGDIVNSVFEGNYAASFSGVVHGGAIYNMTDATLNIIAEDGGVCFFRNNFTAKLDEAGDIVESSVRSEALYCDTGSETHLIARQDGSIIFDDIITGDRSSGGFVIFLEGDASGSVTFKNYVNYGDVVMDDITLVIQVPEVQDDDLDRELGSSYLDDAWREKAAQTIEGVAGSSARSAVLRQAPLFAQSGVVQLADGQITDYLFSIIYATGREEAAAQGADVSDSDSQEGAFAKFNIDLDLSRGVSDVITVFGITPDAGLTWTPTPLKENRLSVSSGHVTLGISFSFENNSYDLEHDSSFREKEIKVQVLNFVMMTGEQNGSYLNDADYEKFRQGSRGIIELSQLGWLHSERWHMTSEDILAADIRLDTTKTWHDSVTIRGWRDPLAAWAELLESDIFYDRDEAVDPWEGSVKKEKVFEIVSNIKLTRDLVDKSDPDRPVTSLIQGKDITIMGVGISAGSPCLDVDGHGMLSLIDSGQDVTLQHFILKGVSDMKISGALTLDTMLIYGDDSEDRQGRVVIANDLDLTIKGRTLISDKMTITGDCDNPASSMLITDGSAVGNGRTDVSVSGVVENQNITHEGSGALKKLADESGAASLDRDSLSSFTSVTTLQDAAIDTFTGNALAMEGGLFRMEDLGLRRLSLRELHVDGGAIYIGSATVDITEAKMGGIDVSGLADHHTAAPSQGDADSAHLSPLADDEPAPESSALSGVIWLDRFEISGMSSRDVIHVKFVEHGVGDTVWDGMGVAKGGEKSGSLTLADSSFLFDWTVTYNDESCVDSSGERLMGYYTLRRGRFAPESQIGPVTDVTGSYVSMMQVYDYAFMHADLYSASIYAARKQRLYSARYSVIAAKGKGSVIDSDPCPATTAGMNRALWLRTYASRESMPLRNGPTTDVNMYGGLIGGDTDLREHSSGWASVCSFYGGYIGSTQKYETVRIRQNGGVIGATATFYKAGFHAALTASFGVSSADATGRGGKEDFDMCMGGIAARAGYNIEFGSGRYVLQPTLMVSYTCFNVYDYTNASGVKIDAKPTNVLQLHPSLKLIRNTDCSWKPYLSAGFVYDHFAKTNFKANGFDLPAMSVRPYLEYSLGVQRSWHDSYTIYAQITGRSAGRRGMEARAGVRKTF